MAIFYITRDVERAIGLLGARNDYYTITNPNPLAEALEDKFSNQFILIRGQERLSTLSLIRNKEVQDTIKQLSKGGQSSIVVFKNSFQIEEECKKIGVRLLNPSAELSREIENKISQYAWLREGKSTFLEAVTPMSEIGEVGQFDYHDLVGMFREGFIIQYNIGHTGSGTKRIFNKSEWENEVGKFSKRKVKISKYIEGTMYTVNACITGDQVVCGRTSEQITGVPVLTSNLLATVGNNWSTVNPVVHEKVTKIASEIGGYMMRDGWKGLFGIDVILGVHEDVDPGHIIEVNARQPASTTLESQLHIEKGELSLIERHIDALLCQQGTKHYGQRENRIEGFQLFFRNRENHPVQLIHEFIPGRYRVNEQGIEFIEKATSAVEAQVGEVFAFSVSKNESVKPGGELLRIQSKRGIFNTFGKKQDRLTQAIRTQLATT
jgi:predicted ATP-grasp superfamily ATP-dependent carboligase